MRSLGKPKYQVNNFEKQKAIPIFKKKANSPPFSSKNDVTDRVKL